MAIITCDGFDHYVGPVQGTWAEVGRMLFTSGYDGVLPRTGNGAIIHTGGRSRMIFNDRTRVGFAIAVNVRNLTWERNLFRFFNIINSMVEIKCDRLGRAVAYGASGAQIGISSVLSIQPGTWNHLECWVDFSTTAGTVELRINEAVAINVSNVNTGNLCNGVGFQDGIALTDRDANFYDDMVVMDASGGVNNGFLGDYNVYTLRPNANTVVNSWTPNTGQAFDAVNDVHPDGDNTYIETGTVGHVTEVALENLPNEVEDIKGAVSVAFARKNDSGTCSLETGISSGGVADVRLFNPTENYLHFYKTHDKNPDTVDTWTKSEIDACLMRFKRTA